MREYLIDQLNVYLDSQGVDLNDEQFKKAIELIEDDINNRLDEFLLSHYVQEVL